MKDLVQYGDIRLIERGSVKCLADVIKAIKYSVKFAAQSKGLKPIEAPLISSERIWHWKWDGPDELTDEYFDRLGMDRDKANAWASESGHLKKIRVLCVGCVQSFTKDGKESVFK